MKKHIRLPSDVYLSSDLKRGGIRFTKNLIDTVVCRGLGLSFSLCAAGGILLWHCMIFDLTSVFPGHSFYLLSLLCVFYLAFYLLRLIWCLYQRRALRRDPNPIPCEAYAVVIFDDERSKYAPGAYRSAVLYKETGSLKPRFFSGPLIRGYRYEFCPERPARVYINRKNPRIYTVDDDKALSLVGSKRRWWQRRRVNQCALDGKSYCAKKENARR